MAALDAVNSGQVCLIVYLIVAAVQVKQDQLADVFRRLDLRTQAVVVLPGPIT
jgi:hypothetical protein